MSSQAIDTIGSRAARLKALTHASHETLDHQVMACRPFDDRGRYLLLLKVQHAFLAQVDSAYFIDALNHAIPGLRSGSRLRLIEQDIADLGAIPLSRHCTDLPLPEALGWLYVAEGSNLGAAFLLKAASRLGLGPGYGARHLGGHPEGRGLQWRRFVEAFDRIALTETEERSVGEGATEAFSFVRREIEAVFLGPVPPGK
jgi:heme oxygenase